MPERVDGVDVRTGCRHDVRPPDRLAGWPGTWLAYRLERCDRAHLRALTVIIMAFVVGLWLGALSGVWIACMLVAASMGEKYK